jgi:hypothetical protein
MPTRLASAPRFAALSSAAGREVTVREIQIYRIADGYIAERWFVVDRTNLQ